MSEESTADVSKEKSRRSLLAVVGAGGAAALAAVLSRSNGARAGHDGTNVLHLGEENTAPAGTVTKLLANVGENGESGTAFIVENANSEFGGAIAGTWHGPGTGGGVRGLNHSPGGGPGLEGESDTGPGVLGFGQPGIAGLSMTDNGVVGRCENPEMAGVLGKAELCLERGPCEGVALGTGVRGLSEGGTGVDGSSHSGPGVAGHSQSGNALEGFSEIGAGAFVSSLSGPGVDATCESGPGVLGWSPGGAGVIGIGSILRGEGTVPEVGPGVLGIAPGSAAAVQCVSGGLVGGDGPPSPDPDGGLALDVVGKARFSTAGAGAVPQGQNTVFVANPAVTADSHVTVTLAGNPGNRQLHWVERNPGVGFRVRLTQGQGPKPPTNFTYLIVEPAA